MNNIKNKILIFGFTTLLLGCSQSATSVFDKDKVLILETSKNKIIWVVGMRLDDRFSVTDDTKEITKIELIR